MNWLQCDSVFGIGVSPFYRSCSLVVPTDVTQEFGAQISDRTEHAAGDDVTLDFGEPVLHLVKPRGIGRRVVQGDVGMGSQEGVDELGLVRREIVGDHMDRLAGRLRGDDLLEEIDELRAGVARCGLAQDLSTLGLQGRVRARASRAESTRSRGTRRGPGKAAAPGPADQALGWRSSRPRRRPPRARAGGGTGR